MRNSQITKALRKARAKTNSQHRPKKKSKAVPDAPEFIRVWVKAATGRKWNRPAHFVIARAQIPSLANYMVRLINKPSPDEALIFAKLICEEKFLFYGIPVKIQKKASGLPFANEIRSIPS